MLKLNLLLFLLFYVTVGFAQSCPCNINIDSAVVDKRVKLIKEKRTHFKMPGYTGKPVRVTMYHNIYKYKTKDYYAILYSEELPGRDFDIGYPDKIIMHVKKKANKKKNILVDTCRDRGNSFAGYIYKHGLFYHVKEYRCDN